MSDTMRTELEAAETAFSSAMISNDPDRIRKCITLDWTLVTPERGPIAAEQVLKAIGGGILVHDTMTKVTHHISVHGDTATVTGRGQNTGWFRGLPIAADEWITDVYYRVDGQWRCALTHLAPALSP